MAGKITSIRGDSNPDLGASNSESNDIDSALDAAGVVDVPSDQSTPPAAPSAPTETTPPPAPSLTAPTPPKHPEPKIVPPEHKKMTVIKTGQQKEEAQKVKVTNVKSSNSSAMAQAVSKTASAPATPPKAGVTPTPPTSTVTPPVTPPKAGVTPPAATPPVTPPAKEEDNEIDAIQEPKGLSPSNSANWKELREKAHGYKKEATELKTKLDEITKNGTKLTPELKGVVEEAQRLVRQLSIEKDPDFNAKYDNSINKNHSDIETLLLDNGLSPEKLDEFKKSGGFNAVNAAWWKEFAVIGPDGRPVKVDGWLTLLDKAAAAGDTASESAAAIIRKKIDENMTLKYERQNEIKKAAEGKSEYHNQKLEAFKKKIEDDNKVMLDEVEKLRKDIPWAKHQEVPPGATPEEKARIEGENAFYAESEARFKIALNPPDALSKVHTAMAACISFKMARDLEAAYAQVGALQQQIAEMRGAGSTSGDGVSTPIGKPETSTADRLSMSNLEAIEAGLSEIENA